MTVFEIKNKLSRNISRQLIFDSFRFFDNITLLRVQEEKEFAPIKDPVGIYSPDTATKLYLKEEFEVSDNS